jgi:hypothetical protein
LHELKSFFGFASYCCRFIHRFADIARSLHLLTSKEQLFLWERSQKTAFQTLKDCLIFARLLASPTNEGKFILDTDASFIRLGAILQQHQDGEL